MHTKWMANKTNEDSYLKLSRKELQSLCKKYGLPANRSHSELATLLISYLEDDLGGSMYNLQEMSSSHLVFQCDESGINHRESLRESFDNTCLGLARDGTVENMPQINCRKIDVGACPVENVIASSKKISSGVPSTSFEFYVMSEEGINLHVDLNSSPSDWTKRFKNEFCISEGVHRDKSQSLHQDLGKFGETDKEMKNSLIWNIDSGQINNGHVQTRSSASSEMTENDHLGFEQPDKCDASLLSSAIMPFSMAIDELKNLKKDQVLISSEPNSNAQNQIDSAAESCAKDRCTAILDSDVSDTPQLKSACNSVINSMSNCPLSPLTLKDQNSEYGNEILENSTLQNSCSLVNPSMVYPELSTSGSMEMPTSEVASSRKDASCSPCENGGSLDLVDLKHNTEKEQGGLANSSELNHNTYRNLSPMCVEEWEKSNDINGRESSECSQIDNSVERTCLSSNDMEFKELPKKRKHIDGEDQSSYPKPDAKILRSSTHIAREVLPRRSMRLSKVSTLFGEHYTDRHDKSTR